MRALQSIAAFAFLTALNAGAQEVRVEVVELANGKPVVGANISLLADSLAGVGGGFSDQTGHTVLRAPSRGAYRVRADKVGYDSWTSVVLQLGANPIHLRIGMSPTRTPAPVVARSETVCQPLTSGTPAGDLWIEIRKALAATALTESQGLVPVDVDIYERVLDRNAAVISERTEQRTRLARRPVTGIAADQLDSTRLGETSGENVYKAPDLATLLSEPFAKSHCFAAIRGYGPETGLTGLEFKPNRVGAGPDLTGILWIDPSKNALKSLAFDYVNLPIPLRVARTSGRLEFQQLPNGQWIVPRWYIRMPRVSQITSIDPRFPAAARDTLVGFQEVGGVARLAGTPAAPVVSGDLEPAATSGGSTISGVVYDSTTGGPLKGVEVSIGGRFKTTTSDGGRYRLAVDGPISDKIVFEHPRLRLLHVAERVQTITLPAGVNGQAFVIVPSYATLRRTLCGQNETSTDAQGMAVGYVRDAAGKPVFNAHVWATWQIQWIERNGRLVEANQQRVVETDTGPDGSYMMCGFTRGAQITFKTGMAGRATTQEKVSLPPSMVLEHDIQLSAR
jgi:hypothetical protein